MQKNILFIVLIALLTLLSGAAKSFAASDISFLSKDAEYDIKVELSSGVVSDVKKVHILGTTDIKNKTFLIVQSEGFQKSGSLFVALDSVKLIIPSDSAKNFIVTNN
jgi:hypothetical protein